MSLPLKVGIVGVGQRGLVHLRSLWKLHKQGKVRLIALADSFSENISEEKLVKYVDGYSEEGITKFSSGTELINSGKVDAVWLVIPPNQHSGEVAKAAERRIAVMLDKPQSLFMDEAISQMEAIERSGVPSMVGFQQRYDNGYEAIRRRLQGEIVASMTMISISGIERHGRKHTHTEKLKGPESRVWTAYRAWSGSSIVEAGIHQTDIMRYWSNSNVSWVQSVYCERPEQAWVQEGDNPIAYTVTYGFDNGAVGNVLFARPARTYYVENYASIVAHHTVIKVESDILAYSWAGEWPPTHIPSAEETKNVIMSGPLNPMGDENTLVMCEAFVQSIVSAKSELRRNSIESSLNSLAAVLASNASNQLGGERVDVKEFMNDARFAPMRHKGQAV